MEISGVILETVQSQPLGKALLWLFSHGNNDSLVQSLKYLLSVEYKPQT